MTEKYSGYLEDFDLSEDDLKGKLILDLGAGARVFSYDCIDGGNRVVSLDNEQLNNWFGMRKFVTKKLANGIDKGLKNWLEVDRNSLVAQATSLPFAENSFDLVLVRSVLMGQADVEIAFEELARILKPGGIAKIFPVLMEHWSDEEKRNALYGIERLKQNSNLKVELWPITYKTTGNKGVTMSVVRLV